METTATERDGGDDRSTSAAGSAEHISITGRAVPLAMGSIRLGGAGRPVSISTGRAANAETSDNNDRQRPRVLLEPHPRSPFGRKLETNVSFSLTTEQETHSRSRFQVQKTTVAPPERVHATHHSTRRTPLATALRQGEAVASTTVSASSASATVVHHARSVIDAKKRSVRDDDKAALTRRPKAVDEMRPQQTIETVKRVKHDSISEGTSYELRPETIAAFVRKPQSNRDEDARGRRRDGFHEHERLLEDITTAAAPHMDHTNEQISGWRAVDDSIDYIYEDPSIDVVQLQLMLHGNRLGGMKRKAVERERLQLAAAEVHKQHQNLTSKMDELRRRKENIFKLSEEIRSHNKPTSKKVSVSSQKKKTVEPIPPHLTRKPPVPRLSQLGAKPNATKKSKKTVPTKADDSPTQRAEEREEADVSDPEDEAGNRQDTSASGLILLGVKSAAHGKTAGSKAPKKRKVRKLRTGDASSHLPQKLPTEPPQEQVQRRAVAREYMQLQKEARQLLKAKVEEEKRYEEERRRMELQRLEQVRLRELEEARKRRIKQKQRDRVSQRKLEEQRLENAVSTRVELASPSKSDDVDGRNDPNTENQSFRQNDPRRKKRNGEFEWPGSDNDLSSPSSPHHLIKDADLKDDTHQSVDPKLLKLLQLEEKAKLLTSRLQSLSNRTKQTDQSSKTTATADITSDTVHVGEEKLGHFDSASDDAEDESVDEDDVDDHGSETRVLDEDDEEEVDSPGDEADEDGVAVDDDEERFSSRRMDQERFAFFEREYRHQTIDEVDEFDLASIGVQKIQVVWPREDDVEGVSDDEPQPSSRFEELLSSNSSSSPPPSQYALKEHDRRDRRENWQSDDSDGEELRSPKLLEDTVGSYAQRLLDQTTRIQHASLDAERDSARSPDAINPRRSASFKTSHWLRDEPTPPRRKCAEPSSDAELLRLIRESDDNLSVIDREAKRRFRIQQDRARLRREEQERDQAEKLQARLTAHVVNPVPSADTRMDEMVVENGTSIEERGSESSSQIVRLEDILQAVENDSAIAETHFSERTQVICSLDSEEGQPASAPPAVEFWNRQLRSVSAVATSSQDDAASHFRPHFRSAPVEIDRTDLRAQRQSQFEAEDEDNADENEHRRIVSPQTLATRLLAAVEYHEAINDAHLQLSMMEKAHALEQVQQDTLALAQAFKEEMDSTLLAQQLVDEHAALEDKFDDDLQQVVGQLDIIRQAEREDHQRELEQSKNEARIARQRESSVQTEPPRLADAMTSARLLVEAAVATESERVDFGVQYVESRAPEETKINRTDESAVPALKPSPLASLSHSENDAGEYTEDYAEETFDRASTSSPGKVNRMNDEISIEGDYDSRSKVTAADEIESSGSVVSDVESEQAVRTESENDDDESDIASENAESNYDDDANYKQNGSSVGEEDEIASTAASPIRGAELSASVRYDENDFEDETSFARSDTRQIASMSDVVEDDEGEVDEKYEEAEASGIASDDDGVKSESYSSQSDDEDCEQRATPAKVTAVSQPPVPSVAPIVASLAPIDFVQPSQLTALNLAADVGHAYVAQLENRKQSEQALLAIRLQALQSKLQQDTQPLAEAIRAEEQKPVKFRNAESLRQLAARRDALQIAFLSEQANLESQKSACVARYYQDLLAFKSLGLTSAVANGLPTASSFGLTLARQGSELVGEVRQAAARTSLTTTKPVEKEGSSVDGYSEDEFASTAGDARTSVKSDIIDSAEASDIADDQSAKSVSQDAEEEEEDIQSVVDEHSGEVDEDSDVAEQSVVSDADDQDYGDDDFASVSESTRTVEKLGASGVGNSVESAPSVADESGRAESGEVEDDKPGDGEVDDEEDADDDFESVSDTAAEQYDVDPASEVEDDASAVRNGSTEAEIVGDAATDDGQRHVNDQSEEVTSDAAYSGDNFEASGIPAQAESSASAVFVSQSDDSSTTKLLVAEVEDLTTKLKNEEEQVNAKLEMKLEKKKQKAQELIEAKEKLIKQKVEHFRREEERVQVDTIAEMALGVDVNAEVEKGKAVVKEKLASEFEALKMTYPELVPPQMVKRVDAKKLVSASAAIGAPMVSVPTTSQQVEQADDYSGSQYSEQYDEYEVESFENDGSTASEANAGGSVHRSDVVEDEGAEDEDREVRESGNDDIASDIEEVGDDKSIADESAEMVEASGDELDDYGDEEFDEAAASSQGGDVDTNGDVEEAGDERAAQSASAPEIHANDDLPVIEDSSGDGDDQYGDEDFEQSISRQSSMASGIGDTSGPEITKEVGFLEAYETEDNAEESDEVLDKMELELETARSQTSEGVAASTVTEVQETVHPVVDKALKPTPLSESLSISHAEEDFVTASMDEQTKRIEDLKRKIEARKQEFAAVQRQLKIEKKKENLREAETHLWTEMEQLESQLVADERILALTRQRGRLESMQLEAKHSDLYYHATDLLEDFDFVEDVEAVKAPVVKQDHQAQVRLESVEISRTDTRSVDASPTIPRDAETEVDFLLAYDHVEVAERPVFTIATSTDIPDESMTILVVEAIASDASGDQPTLTATVTASSIVTICERQYIESGNAFDDASIATDLLAEYDFIASVEPTEFSEAAEASEVGEPDLLQGFNHVELVEEVESIGPDTSSVIEEAIGVDTANNESDDVDDDEEVRSLDESVAESQSDHGFESGDETVPGGYENEESDEEKQAVREEEFDDRFFIESAVVEDTPSSVERASLPLIGHIDGHEDSSVVDDESELTARVTDLVLARLLQDAIADMQASHRSKAQGINAPAEVLNSIVADEADLVRPMEDEQVGPPSPDWSVADEEGKVKRQGANMRSRRIDDDDESASERITDRLFDQLSSSAVVDGVRLHLKQKPNRPQAPVVAPNAVLARETSKTFHTQVTDQDVGLSFAKQLRWTSDGVMLPRLSESLGSRRDVRNTSAIYDAVLETALSVYQRLAHDHAFQELTDAAVKTRTLIDHVQQEMEETVWKRHEAACEALDRFARKAQEDEQGELDETDLRLLRAQQRTGSAALLAHFQATAMRKHRDQSKPSATGTPRQRRRLGSSVSQRGLASQILQQEEDRLADSITDRLMNELLTEELRQPASHQRQRR